MKNRVKKLLKPSGFEDVQGPIEQETLNAAQLMLLLWSPLYVMRILMFSLLYFTVCSKIIHLSSLCPIWLLILARYFGNPMLRKTRKRI